MKIGIVDLFHVRRGDISRRLRRHGVTSLALLAATFGTVHADVELLSVNSDGFQANDETGCYGETTELGISRDGSLVAFPSAADNLVDNDTNNEFDLFLRDRTTQQTVRINPPVVSGGSSDPCNPSMSADGRFVVFETFGKLLPQDIDFPSGDLYLVDTLTGDLEFISVDSFDRQLDGHSYFPDISADGSVIAFQTYAGYSSPRIYVRDRTTDTTESVCVNSLGIEANAQCDQLALSADGRYVAIESLADNLDLVQPDTNFDNDIFVHDRVTGNTTRVSVDSFGQETNSCPGCSDGGHNPDISGDGRYVVFDSPSPSFITDDTNDANDVFLRDRAAETTIRVSVTSTGDEANGHSFDPTISDDGRYIAFTSTANNLDLADVNGETDIYVHDRQTGTTTRVSRPRDPISDEDGYNINPKISGDGSHIAFLSNGKNLLENDENGYALDAFIAENDPDVLRDLPVGKITVDHNWADLCSIGLTGDTVILLGAPTYNGRNPGVARLTDGGRGNCPVQARFQEWDYRARDFGDFWHKQEEISYLGIEPGIHNMPDGSVWEVGTFEQSGNGLWQRVNFMRSYSHAPALFLTMQTRNGGQAANVRARQVDIAGFSSANYEEEFLMPGGHTRERVAYLAIHHPSDNGITAINGTARLRGIDVAYLLTHGQVDHHWRNINGVAFTLQEEQSLDIETAHNIETIDVLLINGQVFAQQVSNNGNNTAALRRR